MKGLLCKDWAILVNSYKKNFLIMVVLYLGMAVCLHMDYLCYALVAVCGVYASSTMNFDDYAHWDTYARTLPVTPGQVVGCKYLLGLLFTLFGSVCAAVGIFLTRATFQARKTSSIPIIILSAKTEDADKILGLNVGADDYVTKPFNPLELNRSQLANDRRTALR